MLDIQIADEEFCFRQGRFGDIYHYRLSKLHWRYTSPGERRKLLAVFVDHSKAFDMLKRNKLMTRLKDLIVPRHQLAMLIRNMLVNNYVHINDGNTTCKRSPKNTTLSAANPIVFQYSDGTCIQCHVSFPYKPSRVHPMIWNRGYKQIISRSPKKNCYRDFPEKEVGIGKGEQDDTWGEETRYTEFQYKSRCYSTNEWGNAHKVHKRGSIRNNSSHKCCSKVLPICLGTAMKLFKWKNYACDNFGAENSMVPQPTRKEHGNDWESESNIFWEGNILIRINNFTFGIHCSQGNGLSRWSENLSVTAIYKCFRTTLVEAAQE